MSALKEFIDKTSEQQGTPINRENLMAIQDFQAKTIYFRSDTLIEEINSAGETLWTSFENDGTIRQSFIGEKTITKTTIFNEDGSIAEVMS